MQRKERENATMQERLHGANYLVYIYIAVAQCMEKEQVNNIYIERYVEQRRSKPREICEGLHVNLFTYSYPSLHSRQSRPPSSYTNHP